MVIGGWLTGHLIWTSVLSNAVTMKFTTAVGFLCTSAMIVLIVQSFLGRHNLALTFLPIPCLTLALLMSSLLISLILNIKTGVENLFVQEDIKALLTVYPGTPSLATIINFILILSAGLIVMVQPSFVRQYVKSIGIIVFIIGAGGLLGYILNCPALYYVIEGISTAIALNTTTLFIFIGMAFILLERVER